MIYNLKQYKNNYITINCFGLCLKIWKVYDHIINAWPLSNFMVTFIVSSSKYVTSECS